MKSSKNNNIGRGRKKESTKSKSKSKSPSRKIKNKKGRSKSTSRERSSSSQRSSSNKGSAKNKKAAKNVTNFNTVKEVSEEGELPAFTSLTKEAVESLYEIEGLELAGRAKCSEGGDYSVWTPTTEEAWNKVMMMLDFDPSIQVIPNIYLRSDCRRYIFNVFDAYKDKLSADCKRNPTFDIPEVIVGQLPVNLIRPYRSALVCHNYMRTRLQTTDFFDELEAGSFLGELTIFYSGRGYHVTIGPHKFYL